MSPIGNKSGIKVFIWSVIAIVFGVVFSGLVVRAFTDKTISENTEKEPSAILAFVEKLKNFTDHATVRAEDALASIDFNKLLYPPEATYHLDDESLRPKVGATAYLVGDVDTGEIILEKNSEEIHQIASVTKLMTALVSLEDLDQSDSAKVSARAINILGTSGQLRQGEKLKISDLIYPLLLVSSNDASEVLAEYKGRDKFMDLMNKKALEINMTQTNYEDPSGLSANNYSTGKDLFALSHYLWNNHRTVFNITALDKYSSAGHTWNNANSNVRRDDYLGGKTGYTDKARRTGVAIFKTSFEGYEDRNIAIILLKTDDRNKDINNILEYLKENVYLSYDNGNVAKNATVDLGFVGDIMLDRGVKTSVYKNWNGDYSKIFDEAETLKNPDIMFANLEGPISDKGHNVGSKYSFRFEPETTKVIKDSGIDVVSFANNHVGDWSDEAFRDTLGRLSEENILFTGAGQNYEDAKKPIVIERSGIKIGYLGFTDVGPEWMAATSDKPGILLANDKNLSTIITEAKKSVDVLVVSVHWGDEYKPHTTRQETLAHKMIDAGADIIAGSHPHVAQDIEEYKDGLIIYSLGNFVFDQYFSDETMQGMFAEVTVGPDGVIKHEEKTFAINSNYQPVLDSELAKAPEFDKGSCPSGNSEDDFLMFNANNENEVGDYIPEGLVEINGHIETKESRTVCLYEEAAKHLEELVNAAEETNLSIIVTSGFRSYGTQKTLYDNKDHSEDGNESVAKPGHSEHQLGTTVDLTTKSLGEISASTSFEGTDEFTWLTKNAYKYGFVMSYPEGADTGYIYEPWHWRYLGTDAAREIHNSNQTIQEYLKD